MEEIWKEIPGFEGLYEVSNIGRVRSLDRFVIDAYYSKGHIQKGRIHKNTLSKAGYYTTSLTDKNKIKKHYYIHRLVASAFIPNPNNYPVINHIDENPRNNSVDNLEWCTQKHNISSGTVPDRITQTAIDHKKKTAAKAIDQYTLDGEYIATYKSAGEVERRYGWFATSVYSCARGYRGKKTAYGFVWKFADDKPLKQNLTSP